MLLFFKQASLDGLTGPLHFSEDGARTNIEMDILNLRNNSFKKVGHKNYKIICCCVLYQTFYLMNGVFFNYATHFQPGTDSTLRRKKKVN